MNRLSLPALLLAANVAKAEAPKPLSTAELLNTAQACAVTLKDARNKFAPSTGTSHFYQNGMGHLNETDRDTGITTSIVDGGALFTLLVTSQTLFQLNHLKGEEGSPTLFSLETWEKPAEMDVKDWLGDTSRIKGLAETQFDFDESSHELMAFKGPTDAGYDTHSDPLYSPAASIETRAGVAPLNIDVPDELRDNRYPPDHYNLKGLLVAKEDVNRKLAAFRAGCEAEIARISEPAHEEKLP